MKQCSACSVSSKTNIKSKKGTSKKSSKIGVRNAVIDVQNVKIGVRNTGIDVQYAKIGVPCTVDILDSPLSFLHLPPL